MTHKARMQHRRLRPAVVLVVVILYVALAFGFIALLAATGSLFNRRVRADRQDVQLRQMLDSGYAWALVHADELVPGEDVELPAASFGEFAGTIRLQSGDDTVRVSASLVHAGRTRATQATFSLP